MEKKNGNHYIGLYRDYSKDPFLGCRDVGCTAM